VEEELFIEDSEKSKKIREYIELIKKEKKMSEKEIINEYKKLKEELDSLITDEETLFEILMRRLGIKKEEKIESVEKEIKDLVPGEYVIVKGKVISVRVSDKFASLRLYDGTGSVRVVTFDPKRFINIYEGSTIKIIDGFVRETNYGKEILVSNKSKIEVLEEVKFERKKLNELTENEKFESIVLISNVYEPKTVKRLVEKEEKVLEIEKTITPLKVIDETDEKMAYFDGNLKSDLEGKTVIIRGKAFLSQKGDLRLSLSSIILFDLEEELDKMLNN
jgi:hypothetical protein